MNATKNAPNMVEQIIDPSLDAFPNWKAWATAASDCMEEISNGTIVQTKIVWGMNPKYPRGIAAGIPIVANFSDDLGNHLTRSFFDDEVNDTRLFRSIIIHLWGDWLAIRSDFDVRQLIEKMHHEEELVK